MMKTLVLALAALQISEDPTARQTQETIAWRADRLKDLQAERGWLAVSALPWLKEGETSIGTAEGNVIRLGDGPPVWGKFVRTRDKVTAVAIAGPAIEMTTAAEPFQIGRSWIQLIKRSDLVGLRIWDPMNARKQAFRGLEWYDVKSEYRVRGRFIKTTPMTSLKIANVIGQTNDFKSPGRVQFTFRGATYELTPVYETSAQDELFYIFKDATAAKTTYGAGRFLHSARPDQDGTVIVDFNRAYSPPCAFTDFATCPLPPAVNRLDLALEAGEKDPHKGH